jgi:hypothetical protein
MIWIIGPWLNEANVLLTRMACKSGWQGKDPSIEHATNFEEEESPEGLLGFVKANVFIGDWIKVSCGGTSKVI